MEIYIPPFLLCVTSTIYDFLCCYLCKIVRHCLLIRGTKIYFALNKDRNFSAIKHLNGVHIRFDDRKYCFISVNLSCRVVLYCIVLSFTLSLSPTHTHLPKCATLCHVKKIFISTRTSVIIEQTFPLFHMFAATKTPWYEQ